MRTLVSQDKLRDFANRKKLFIFDFDGVLVDSVEIKAMVFYSLYKKYGTAVAEKVLSHHRLNGGMSRYNKFRKYHKEYLGKDITQNEIDDLDDNFSAQVMSEVVNAEEILGAKRFLDNCCISDNCFVCSATPEMEIRDIIIQRGWTKYFSSIFGSPATKIENIEKVINSSVVPKKKMLYFGDAHADYMAARECGIDFIGVGNYWQDKENLDALVGTIQNFRCLLRQ